MLIVEVDISLFLQTDGKLFKSQFCLSPETRHQRIALYLKLNLDTAQQNFEFFDFLHELPAALCYKFFTLNSLFYLESLRL